MLKFPAAGAFRLTNATLKIHTGVAFVAPIHCSFSESGILCPAPRRSKALSSITLETIPNVNFTRGRRLQIKYVTDPKFNKIQDGVLLISHDQEIRLTATAVSLLR